MAGKVGELTVGQGHRLTVQLGETLSSPHSPLLPLLVHLRCVGGREGGGGGSRGGWLRLLQAVQALSPGGQGGLAVERVRGVSLHPGGGQTEIIVLSITQLGNA